MCASVMFNTKTDPSIMNFEPPIKSNHLLSSSPSSSFNSLQTNQQLSIDQNVNTSNNLNYNQQFIFNPNSSPTYTGYIPDDMKIGYKKKAKHCLVCGEPAFYFFYGSLCCDACRTFFRRSSLQNSKNLKCPFDSKCVINNRTRKDCSKCRLNKCLEVGMRPDLIVNAKEERKRKQSINLYDFHAINPASTNTPNLYGLSNSFTNNFPGFSAIQSEYDQYLKTCLNYANAYYMHNSLNELNTNLSNSSNTNVQQQYTQQSQASTNNLESLNQMDNLNSLNQLNYPSSLNQFLFNNENSNSSLDANYLNNQLITSPQHHCANSAGDSLPSTFIDGNPVSIKLQTDERIENLSSTNFISTHQSNHINHSSPNLSTHLTSQLTNNTLRSSTSNCQSNEESDEVTRQIRKLSFALHNDDNAEDGFDRYSNEIDYDKLDLNKLDLNNKSFSCSLSSSSSCSSLSSHNCSNNQLNSLNLLELDQTKLMNNNYNWKKRKIQYLTGKEIEKENRKVFRNLVRQTNLVKRQRLEEIVRASKRLMKQPEYKLNDLKLNEEDSISRSHLLVFSLKWHFFGIAKLCKSFQELTSYRELDPIEKKYLLMSNCTHILMLSSTKYYNFNTHCWDVNVKLINQDNKRIKMPVSVEVMNTGSKKELASYYTKLMDVFDRAWLEDEILMSLIFVICLFTPNEKLMKKVKHIKYEYECYLSLLEDHLEKKLKCREKVKSQVNLIKTFLTKLKEFKEIFENAHVVLAKEEHLALYRHLTEQLAL